MTKIIISTLKKRLIRLKEQRDELLEKHQGKELNFTYWGGYELGVLKGKIHEIEDLFDNLKLEI